MYRIKNEKWQKALGRNPNPTTEMTNIHAKPNETILYLYDIAQQIKEAQEARLKNTFNKSYKAQLNNKYPLHLIVVIS